MRNIILALAVALLSFAVFKSLPIKAQSSTTKPATCACGGQAGKCPNSTCACKTGGSCNCQK